jgi:aspartate carbamoyltransferase catalytic subunit
MRRDLISIDDLTIDEIRTYLDLAARIEHTPERDKVTLLQGKVLAVMFFEPSTRTRLSFETAMQRLGGGVVGFSDILATSVKKGESFLDTIRTVECYSDVLVCRHPKEGTARLATEVSRIPVINAGDGTNQHPTQTLLDLYTIQKFFGQVDGIRIGFAGDLKYSRTVHSLLHALMMFDGVEFILASPTLLALPDYLKLEAQRRGHTLYETDDLMEAVRNTDCLYMTRIQQERFPDPIEYESVKNAYILDAAMLKDVPAHFKVLHPLPRVNEISYDVDETRHAGYFEQVLNGVYMRQAILLDVLEVLP